jgi:hypothetical protein
MALNLDLILLVAAFVCFVAAAAGVSARVALTPLGLAFWVLTLLV